MKKNQRCWEIEFFEADQKTTIETILKTAQRLARKYGKKSVIEFDAGYNNVGVYLYPEKDEDEEKPT